MWSELLTRLKAILDANTNIQEVYDYVPDRFSGDPVAIITPSENENDYHTTNENLRIYSFSIKLFVSRTAKDNNTADKHMRTLVNSILDDYDKNWNLSTTVDPTGYTFLNLFAVPSAWGYSGEKDEYRASEIIVRARVAVDVTLIS